MATAFPIQLAIGDGVPSKIIYLEECTYVQLMQSAQSQLTMDQLKHNTFVIEDDNGIVYSTNEDLQHAFAMIMDTDGTTPISPLHLHVNFTPKYILQVQKDSFCPFFIQATAITEDRINIKLLLCQPLTKTTSFYIYPCDEDNKEDDRDCLAQFNVKKGMCEAYEYIDTEDIDGKSFDVALYPSRHAMSPLSNVLHAHVPDPDNIQDYKPNPVSLSSVQATEVEGDDGALIYIHWQLPEHTYGDDIMFNIHYVDHVKQTDELMMMPLIISKSSTPISFSIVTVVTRNDEVCRSTPSDPITVDYEQEMEHRNEEYALQLLSITDSNVFVRFDVPKSNKKRSFYIHVVGKENDDYLEKIRLRKNVDHVIQNIDMDEINDYICDEDRTITISVYNECHSELYITPPITIHIPQIEPFHTHPQNERALHALNGIILHKHKIHATVKDRYACTTYLFNFENISRSGSDELQFAITIDCDAFISKFEANIDGELFYGQTKQKETASAEYEEAKERNENAILISQPYADIPNVFQIQTNMDAGSKISLKITMEQYLRKELHFNQLNIQILRDFAAYNIAQNFDYISFVFDINDESGLYDVQTAEEDIIIESHSMGTQSKQCVIHGRIMTKVSSINELTLRYKIKGEQSDSHFLFDRKTHAFCHIISDLITDSRIMDEGQSDVIKDNINIQIPRRVVFVLDRSGSMKGTKWDQTVSSSTTALKQLKSFDRVNVMLFDHDIELLWTSSLAPCHPSNMRFFIQALQDKEVRGA
eukprot:770060_1